MSAPRSHGYGSGYCYTAGKRALLVCAESLQLARLCCAPTLRLRAVRTYPANPRRSVFVFAFSHS
jgi:hypothetical protein